MKSLFAILFLSCFRCSFAAVITVPGNYATIQAAIDASSDGDEIIVSPGTYYENIHFNGKNITLRSTDPDDYSVCMTTLIHGGGVGTVVTFSGSEQATCVLSGFYITGGRSDSGAGICGCGTHATISNNIVYANRAELGTGSMGGGIYDCDGIVEGNTIMRNWACGDYIGGGGIARCDGIMQNNRILENTVYVVYGTGAGGGGGIYDCHGIIQNNIISGNKVSAGMVAFGGGIGGCNGIIQNNTIYANMVLTEADARGGGLDGCAGVIRNCIIWQNSAGTGAQLYDSVTPSYCCIQGGSSGTGNIAANPGLADPSNYNFHLLPGSACIDAGCYIPGLTEDYEGDARPWNTVAAPRGDGSDFDIGADESGTSLLYDFTAAQEGWTTGGAVVFTPPQWMFDPGRLTMTTHESTNSFGFWQSPPRAIPISEGYLYRARFTVTTNITEPTLVPVIRLRVNSSSLQQADYRTIESTGDAGASPIPSGRTYDLYFVPPANEGFCALAFDVLNFEASDVPEARVSLEQVSVQRYMLNALGAPVQTWAYEFATGQETWSSGDGQGVFTDPEFFWAGGAVQMRSTTNTNTFGYWHSAAGDIITSTAPLLYRGTFTVRTDVTQQSRAPQLRLRFNTGNLQASRTMSIESVGDGANSPATTNTAYNQLYFLPPGNCLGGGLIVSFDMLNFSPDDAPTGSLILDRAVIEALNPPGTP